MKGLCLLALAMVVSPLSAEVSNLSEHGFTVRHTVETEAEPFIVYRTMTNHIDQWWSADHSWSGDAANLYMKVERNGCFCEKLPGGGNVEHLRLIYYAPGKELRFDGALGPLQAMPVNGRMIWRIEDLETGSRISFTYHVTAYPGAGLTTISPAVDGVIGEQLDRLAKRLAWN